MTPTSADRLTPAPILTFEGGLVLVEQGPYPADIARAVCAIAAGQGLCDEPTLFRLRSLLDDLVGHLTANGVEYLTRVPNRLLSDWCRAGADESAHAAHERRAALFTAACVLRALDADNQFQEDLKVELEPLTPNHRRRPLLPLERAAVRAAAYRGQQGWLRRRVVALAESGAQTEEIPQVLRDHLDYDGNWRARVSLVGTSRAAPRTLKLTAWAHTQLCDAAWPSKDDGPIAYTGAKGPGRPSSASTSGIGTRIMREAGLTDGDVTLESLRNTRAVQAWNGHDLRPVKAVLGSTTKNADQTAANLVRLIP